MQQINYYMGEEYTNSSVFCNIASFIVMVALTTILYFGYYRKKRVYVVRLKKFAWMFVWLLIFAFVPANIFHWNDTIPTIEERYSLMSVHFGWMLIVLGLVAPVFSIFDEARRYLSKQNQYQQTYLEAELDYIARYKESQNETRAFRHDIVNHLSLVNMLMDTGKMGEAKEHVQELLGNVAELSPKYVTGDEMLDCIVAMKAEKMRGNGIDFSTDGVVDGGLSLKPMEICSIFANALDNSIEAAMQTKEPKVSMKIKRTEQFFIIDIANSVNQKVNVNRLLTGGGYTSKKDKQYHGFGLRNIQNSVEKNDGMLRASSTDDVFSLSIMLPRREKAS